MSLAERVETARAALHYLNQTPCVQCGHSFQQHVRSSYERGADRSCMFCRCNQFTESDDPTLFGAP